MPSLSNSLPSTSRGRRMPSRRAAMVAGGLALLAAGALALEPLAQARIENRLSDRIGPIASLSIAGSPLGLLQGRPDEVAVHFRSADLAGGASGDRDLDRIARLDLRADALQTERLRFEAAHITKRDDAIHARLRVPPQEVSLGGASLPVTPQADDGELFLALGSSPGATRLHVFSDGGRLRVGVDGTGPFGDVSRPVASASGLAIDALRAEERDGEVVIALDAQLTDA